MKRIICLCLFIVLVLLIFVVLPQKVSSEDLTYVLRIERLIEFTTNEMGVEVPGDRPTVYFIKQKNLAAMAYMIHGRVMIERIQYHLDAGNPLDLILDEVTIWDDVLRGFYHPETETIYISLIESGCSLDGYIVHELVHWLQEIPLFDRLPEMVRWYIENQAYGVQSVYINACDYGDIK